MYDGKVDGRDVRGRLLVRQIRVDKYWRGRIFKPGGLGVLKDSVTQQGKLGVISTVVALLWEVC